MSGGYAANKRWRLANPDKRQAESKRRNDRSRKTATNDRQLWTQDQDRRLMEASRPSDQQLAVELGRSYAAIQQRRVRLVKLGKTVEPRA